ncbi:MAG TPA: FAD-dependent oxidoreductase [Steroidobacteraceae bacterium]|nr:FAD-dependent oxidoreductase [Steroidobacteraceae bacterium]
MLSTHYLIAGASHAALSALEAIRMADTERELTLVAKDDCLPYSPTVLPYVVSGHAKPERVFLQDDKYFERTRTSYLRGRSVTHVDTNAHVAQLSDGTKLKYQKLLLATGARPAVPPIPGLERVPMHVLRTLDDALRLHECLPSVRRAIVLGGGLIGMHAAENLRKGGANVTIVEIQPQVLPAYFDTEAAAIIARIFAKAGVDIRVNMQAASVTPRDGGFTMELQGGESLEGDLLVVATGVTPVMDYLTGTPVATDRGILVNDTMGTNVSDVWAAGDVAQARGFYTSAPVLNGIVPYAVEQGRIAGMAMAEDPALGTYRGGVPLNTYSFWGRHAVSVGTNVAPQGAEVVRRLEGAHERYLKIILDGNRLHGIFGVNEMFDAGVMWELILRRIDLGAVRERFLARPNETARAVMSKTWR